MAKPRIAVFSGARSTIANSPTLVTSSKGRLPGDRSLPGRFDHLVAQTLYEPVTVRIKRFSAHPLEEDASDVYHDPGQDFLEVELRPEDGPYLLPYVARRSDGSPNGVPFEESDLSDAALVYGTRQFFYPDASRLFEEIDRSISGRDEHGEGSILDRRADFEFIRVLPPGGYTSQGEVAGVDYFPYKPFPVSANPPARSLARVTNMVQSTLDKGDHAGAIWMEGSPHLEETLYWLGLLIDTDLPLVGVAAQRTHGQLSADGDRNIVDAVDYILSGQGNGLGAVGVQDEQVFAARDFKKGDDRPGGYKTTGGHGGILGTVGPPVTIWYRPAYRHTSTSDTRLSQLPAEIELPNGSGPATMAVKDSRGALNGASIPRVHIVKYAHYMTEDETADPDHEVDILARIQKGLDEQGSTDPDSPRLHGFVLEGVAPYGFGSKGQMAALGIAALSGMPVVRVGRGDPEGRVPSSPYDLTIEGSNLDANKARLLLMSSMLKLGRLPKARDPRHPTTEEREAAITKIAEFQELFETH